jgi:hypothetical protein
VERWGQDSINTDALCLCENFSGYTHFLFTLSQTFLLIYYPTQHHIKDVTLNSLPLKATNEIFYLYADGLTSSDIIQGTVSAPIKAATVNEHLKATANFVKVVGQRGPPAP